MAAIHWADDILKCIFFDENITILIQFPLQFIPEGPIDNTSVLVQIKAWRRTGDQPLSEPMIAWFTYAYMRHSASMS